MALGQESPSGVWHSCGVGWPVSPYLREHLVAEGEKPLAAAATLGDLVEGVSCPKQGACERAAGHTVLGVGAPLFGRPVPWLPVK